MKYKKVLKGRYVAKNIETLIKKYISINKKNSFYKIFTTIFFIFFKFYKEIKYNIYFL